MLASITPLHAAVGVQTGIIEGAGEAVGDFTKLFGMAAAAIVAWLFLKWLAAAKGAVGVFVAIGLGVFAYWGVSLPSSGAVDPAMQQTVQNWVNGNGGGGQSRGVPRG